MTDEIGVDPDLDNRGTAKAPAPDEVYLVNNRKVGRVFVGNDDPIEPGHKRRMKRKAAEKFCANSEQCSIEECAKGPKAK